jgi:class 3 adenylate cyclase
MNGLVAKFGHKLANSGFWRQFVDILGCPELRVVLWADGEGLYAEGEQPAGGALREIPCGKALTLQMMTAQPLVGQQVQLARFIAEVVGLMWVDFHVQRSLSHETLKRYRETALLLKAGVAFNGMLQPQAIAAHLLSYFHNACGAAVLTPEGAVVAGSGVLAQESRIVLDLPPRPHLQNEGARFGWRAYLWSPLETETPLNLLIVSTKEGLTFDTVDLQKVNLLVQLAHAALNTAHQFQARQTLSRYMALPVVEALLRENADALGGTEQDATILFADIRNFTTLTARQGARETVSFLNSYFGRMVEVVREHKGIVDKFLGDGLLAVFGVPFPFAGKANQAVLAAEAMQAEVARLVWPGLAADGGKVRIGIGISSGTVIAGNVGSAERMDYTVIGDPVNQAAKLQDISKKTGSAIVLTEATYSRLSPELQARYRRLEMTLGGVGVFGAR